MAAYYNENEPFCVQWLRNLIAAGHIAPGDVDGRSIVDIQADDLRGYEQCHFFAGISGWSYALRLAGWPDDRPVWTGSCPCQPFSNAGKQRGSDDERHLWPAWFRLISECRPSTIFGEQVAGAAGLAWLDHVCADLEGSSYAAAAADLPACSVGAPHIRQRLWWVANSNSAEKKRQRQHCRKVLSIEEAVESGSGGVLLADSDSSGLSAPRAQPIGTNGQQSRRMLAAGNRWAAEPAVGRVAHGVPARVGRLRAYGNAIVPQVAAEFIAAVMECMP